MDINVQATPERERVLPGIFGALLFAMAGGVVWFLLYQLGYIASLSGLVAVICAAKGYTLFAKTKNESVKCVVISLIASVVVLAAAWYLCLAFDVYSLYQESFAAGEVEYTVTLVESLVLVPYFLEDPEVLVACLKDLGTGLLFAAIGFIYYLSMRERRRKKMLSEKAAEEAAREAALASCDEGFESRPTDGTEEN